MKKIKRLAVMAVVCFVTVAMNAQVVRDTVVVNQKEYVFITDSLSNKEIAKMLENEDSIMVLTNKSSLNDTTCYVYALYAKEGGKITRYKNNELRKASSSRKHDVLSDVLKDSSWRTHKPLGLSDNLYVNSLKTMNIAKKNSDQDRDAYVAVVNGMPVDLLSGNRYGFSFGVYGGYKMSDNLASPVVGLRAEYSQRWGYLAAQAEYGTSKFSEFSQHPDKEYGTFSSQFEAAYKPFEFDRFDCHRLMVFAGFGFEYYGTDSPIHDGGWIQSWGNVLYPTLGIHYENRGFCRNYSWYLRAEYRALNSVVQNDELVTRHTLVASLGVTLDTFREMVKNFPKKVIKRLQREY